MKKTLFRTRLFYIIMLFGGIFLLSGKLMYEREKSMLDSEQTDKITANKLSYSEAVSLEDMNDKLEYVEGESGDTTGAVENGKNLNTEIVCEKLRLIDFTIREYPINTEVYTEEINREYKEIFLGVLFNQIPIQLDDGEQSYFNEIDLRDKESSEEDYTKIIKQYMNYYYLDFDGDGFPELIVEPRGGNVRFGGPRIFKYDRDSKKVYVDGYRFMKYRPLCAGKFYYEDNGGASAIRYGYQEINSQGKIIEEATFQLVYPAYENPERYFITSVGEFENVNVEIDKESWDEMLHDFFEAKDNAVEGITFDELFSDIEHP